MRTIDNINDLNKSDFLSVFGNVFEKTESVAVGLLSQNHLKTLKILCLKCLIFMKITKRIKF